MTLALGTRRYVSMLTDIALVSIVTGRPVREALASAIESALSDQAMVCDMVGAVVAAEAGEAIERWYREVGAAALRSVRPAIGVGDEVPMTGSYVIGDWNIDAAPERAAEGGGL